MHKFKPYIVGSIVGSVLTISLLGGGFLVYKSSQPLFEKVVIKIKDWRLGQTHKAKEELMICDFESPESFNKWESVHSEMQFSKSHCTQSNTCAKVYFQTGGQMAAIKLIEAFEKSKALSNWAPYEGLAFDVYNPQVTQERILFQIRDKKGNIFKEDFYVDANSVYKAEIETTRLNHVVDIFHISELALFLWQPGQTKIFYLDNFRLIPSKSKPGMTILSKEFFESSDVAYKTGDYFDFSKNKRKWFKNEASASFVEFPIYLLNETHLDFVNLPFGSGVPFPRGELQDAQNVEILDANGQAVDFQAKPICKWQDGSIRWLLVDLKSDVNARRYAGYRLRYAQHTQHKNKESHLKISDEAEQITITTGPLRFTVKKKNFNLFDKVWIDENEDGIFQDEELITQKSDLAIEFKNKIYLSSLDKNSTVLVEEKGPIKSTIKAEGWFVNEKGKKFCKYVVRIQAFADSAYLRVYHTFIYTGYPENKYHYLYKRKSLPANETIDAISILLPFHFSGEQFFTFRADDNVMRGAFSEDTDLLQGKHNSCTVEKAGMEIHAGQRLAGWLDVGNEQRGVAVGIKNFWQQFPKEFYLDKKNNQLVIALWPKKAGKLDLKTTEAAFGPDAVARGSAFGLAKTHELIFYFRKGDYKTSGARGVLEGLMQPLLIQVPLQWISDTVALGKVSAYEEDIFGSSEETLERLFDWAQRQKEKFPWYGMIDFGDTLSWYRQEAYDKSYEDWGWHPEGRWGWFNCEAMGTHMGAFIQYLRTGQTKYFKFGEDLTRHIMDIDTCHYNTVANDKRLKNRIPDDYSRVGSMHRHNGNHWGGRNEEASHTSLNGILLYYYITGYERAFDVAKEIGEFFLKSPITYFRHPDVAPLRSIANVLWGEVALYEATGDERYLKAADRWADILYKGQNFNGSWPDSYNPRRKSWQGEPHLGYMNSYALPALIEYHKMTHNKLIGESIVEATEYLIGNDEYGHPFDAIAYSFWLTGKNKFKDEGRRRLQHLMTHQNRSGESIMDGMIYGKAYYARAAEFLYRTPYIFAVLAIPAEEEESQ